MSKRKISLEALYKEKLHELSPARQLIHVVALATNRSEITVRMWIMGKFRPEEFICDKIAEVLDLDPDFLFPTQNDES